MKRKRDRTATEGQIPKTRSGLEAGIGAQKSRVARGLVAPLEYLPRAEQIRH
jgi:hypothetical protein